jgi:hypothetical protein
VAPESRVVGAGELVDHPKKIALYYIRGYFFIDLFVVLPLPQVRTLSLILFPLSTLYLSPSTYDTSIHLLCYNLLIVYSSFKLLFREV